MKFACTLLILCVGPGAFSQGYLSLAPSLTNSAGTIADKSNLAIELGQQWDVFSMGIDYGKTTLSKVTGTDTTNYIVSARKLSISILARVVV